MDSFYKATISNPIRIDFSNRQVVEISQCISSRVVQFSKRSDLLAGMRRSELNQSIGRAYQTFRLS
jgi:hypothetical protein